MSASSTQPMAARNSLSVDASVTNSNLEWYVGRSCCSLLVPLVRRSLGVIICVDPYLFKKEHTQLILIGTFNSIRIRIFYFRKPKVSSEHRQDTESVKLEDAVSYIMQFDYCVY